MGKAFGSCRSDASLLVKLGDPVATEEALQKFEEQTNWGQQRRAFGYLSRAGRPDVIVRMKKNLFTEETPEGSLFEEDMRVTPLSVQSTRIILQTLVVAPGVADNVREWAGLQSQSSLTNAELRERVRRWFLQNTTALEQQRYSELTVLR
ncbi:MAG: hypothetical protein JWM68_4656 [Verrucomicrobiales bacterium]|nr:hypothetical protein [Verrucomicrobiales bacterium]